MASKQRGASCSAGSITDLSPEGCGGRDIRKYLLGEWRLQRRIEDRRTQQVGTFLGACTFSPLEASEDTLICREDGRVRMNGQDMKAHRIYHYVFCGPRKFAVQTEDGDVLLNLNLEHGQSEDRHLCIADTYRGNFEIVGDDLWTQSWTVTGPKKNYALHARLNRVKPSN